MKLITKDNWSFDGGPFGGPITSHWYDTTAWFFTSKIYQPLPEDSVLVFPCPSLDKLYLKSNYTVKSMYIYDAGGRIVSELYDMPANTTHSIEIINLEKGIYILRGELSNGNSFYKKIIVGG